MTDRNNNYDPMPADFGDSEEPVKDEKNEKSEAKKPVGRPKKAAQSPEDEQGTTAKD